MKNKIILFLILVLVRVAIFFGFKNINKISDSNALSIMVVSIFEKDQMFNINAEYPQFKLANDAFNKKIEELINQKLSSFKENASRNWEALRSMPDSPFGEYPAPFYFEAVWKPIQTNKDYISFVINLYSFEGGAHGNSEVFAFNYDLKNKKEVTFKDFIGNSQEKLNKISKLVIADLEGQILITERDKDDEELKSMIREGASPKFENYENFSFYKNKLAIYFQKYQVAPGVFDTMEVKLYENQLKQIGIPYFE